MSKAKGFDWSKTCLTWGTPAHEAAMDDIHRKHACDKNGKELPAMPLWSDKKLAAYQTLTRKF